MDAMTDDELSDALDGLKAYDAGFLDSGIHDEALRTRVRATLRADKDRARLGLSRHVRERYLTEDRLAQGYGIEDVASFLEWLADEMHFDVDFEFL